MSVTEPVYTAQVTEKRNRLTVFFRAILWIPHYVVLLFYAILSSLSLVLSWFALVITGRYPAGLYSFNGHVQQYLARQTAYLMLQVDAYPPFRLKPTDPYPVELTIPPALERYDRVKVFFRFFLVLPIAAVQTGLGFVLLPVSALVWLVCLFKGRTSAWFHDVVNFVLSFNARSQLYVYLMTEQWTPLVDTEGGYQLVTEGFIPGPSDLAAPAPPAAPNPFGRKD